MKEPLPQPDAFEAAEAAAEAGQALVVDLDGFEGPLHLLLALARSQKVDLLQISVTRLADQYLAYVRQARARRLALAADYLVMAAWLAFLKSRLLLPKPERQGEEEPPADAVAALLAFRLAKLDAVRRAVEALQARAQVGRDVFLRGAPEPCVVSAETRLEADLYGLMQAYVDQRRRVAGRRYAPERRIDAYPLEAARLRLKALAPDLDTWTPLAGVAPAGEPEGEGPGRASCIASTLSAGLELVKDGELELRQLQAFAALYLRRAQARRVPLAAE